MNFILFIARSFAQLLIACFKFAWGMAWKVVVYVDVCGREIVAHWYAAWWVRCNTPKQLPTRRAQD